jgi:hypothetical protein
MESRGGEWKRMVPFLHGREINFFQKSFCFNTGAAYGTIRVSAK